MFFVSTGLWASVKQVCWAPKASTSIRMQQLSIFPGKSCGFLKKNRDRELLMVPVMELKKWKAVRRVSLESVAKTSFVFSWVWQRRKCDEFTHDSRSSERNGLQLREQNGRLEGRRAEQRGDENVCKNLKALPFCYLSIHWLLLVDFPPRSQNSYFSFILFSFAIYCWQRKTSYMYLTWINVLLYIQMVEWLINVSIPSRVLLFFFFCAETPWYLFIHWYSP